MKYSFFPAFISLILAVLLSGCVQTEQNIPQSSSEPSEENTAAVSEESAIRESWRERYEYDNEIVTFQYLEYGNIMIKTIEKYNFVDVMIAKDEYILENEIPIKKTFWEYRDDGELIQNSYEEIKTNGTLKIVIEHNDFENDLYTFSEYIYSDESRETLLSSASLYKNISEGKSLIEKKTGTFAQNGYDFSTETLIYYKDNEIHHYAVTKTSSNDGSSEYSIFDADKKGVITYYYTKEKENQSIRCYREKGFIQVDITETLLTYYESNDGATKILVGEIKINPETGKQNASKYNKDVYTAREANRIMEKYEDLYDAAIEFKNDVDYSA